MTLRAFEDWIETAGPPPESPETALLRSMWPLLQPRLANADNPIPHKDAYLRALQDALERWQNAQPPEAARVYWPALQRSFETAWVAWRKSWSVCG